MTFKIPDLIAKARELNQPYKAKRAAHSVMRQARLNAERDRKAALEFLADAKAAVVALVGRKNDELTDFGFKPDAPRKRRSAKPKTNQGPQPGV
ncbi:MAG: hypothetical protein ACAI25_09415 [Planctomycetota bacterium]